MYVPVKSINDNIRAPAVAMERPIMEGMAGPRWSDIIPEIGVDIVIPIGTAVITIPACKT
jgi:hypothetical protein